MIATLLLLHAVAVVGLAAAGDRLGRRGLLVAAAVAATTAVWACTRIGGDPAEAELTWVAGLDLDLVFRVDTLAATLTLLVSGIGALVFVYASGYFSAGTAGVGRFAATLLAFSATMVGLVWSDSIWTLFVFWELTSVTSFLLVGHKRVDAKARKAARRALMITAAGGLVLLGGMVVLADATGTTRLTDMPVAEGTAGTVAAVLLVIAAATKSAQVPFHVWLPGAMVAPTPVSAYLHSATMVKAGVILVAVTSPALSGIAAWRILGLVLGGASIVWGAIGALRHRDAKLILAWGTVSQLGLMITLLSLGEPKATFAAISILVAHAVFKAALFMVVGEIDVRTGTRDITALGGLARSMPLAFAVAVVSAASMAGVPPMLGFAAKEAAIEGVLGASGGEAALATVLVVGGSVLTVAYSTRLVYGLFGPGPEVKPSPARTALAAPAALLGVVTVVGFAALGVVNDLVRPAATEIDPGAEVYSLLRWPGFTTGLGVSVAVLVAGAGLGWALRTRVPAAPRSTGADATDTLIDGVLVVARIVTARVQHGSLPVYLVVMMTVLAAAAVPFVGDVDPDSLRRWDHPLQPVLGAATVGAALAAARVGSRLGAALGLGAVGVGVSSLFVLHGAPDLALTQLLVETVIVVGFVIALGHLARRFPRYGLPWRSVRIGVSLLAAGAVGVALAAASAAPTGAPPLDDLLAESVDEGGGNNVVNVVLTDMRALDTLGEIVVLAVAAIGVLALAASERRKEPAS